jgi:serine/threonine protein kinase
MHIILCMLCMQARNGDRAMVCRLTWTRRLLMALDAARGMLYLHSHKPIILHRDLKSPNLFVTK